MASVWPVSYANSAPRAALASASARVAVLGPERDVHHEVADAPVLDHAGHGHELEVDRFERIDEGGPLFGKPPSEILDAAHGVATFERKASACSR